MAKMADVIIRFRWLIIIVFIAVTLYFASHIPLVEIESDMKAMLPRNIESRINTDKIDEIFGGTEMLMVILRTDDVLATETLMRAKSLSKQVKRIKGVDKVLSLFELKDIKGEGGAMIVEPAVGRIPQTEKQREELREEIIRNDIVYGSFEACCFLSLWSSCLFWYL